MEQSPKCEPKSGSQSDKPDGEVASDFENVDHRKEQLMQWFDDYINDREPDYPSNPILTAEEDHFDLISVSQRIEDVTADVKVLDRFCEDCHEMFGCWPVAGEDGACVCRFDSIGLEARARKGCKFCAFLLQVLLWADELVRVRKIEARLRELDQYLMSSVWISHTEDGTSMDGRISQPGKVKGPKNPNFLKNYLSGRFMVDCCEEEDAALHDSPRKCLDVAIDWLHNCTQRHSCCVDNISYNLPTRLVHITQNGPRLVLTKNWTNKPPYATLSHCWGHIPFAQLTQQNCASFLHSIPLAQLPKTFVDAIDTTWRLGLDFIWIDSLCIIQDDEDDWRIESARMTSVYSGSHINIAASSSKTAHEGFPILERPELTEGLRARVTYQDSDRSRTAVMQFEIDDLYDSGVKETHLAGRAWAFQERVLAPRTIHFGHRGIFWECAKMIANESLPGGMRVQRYNPGLARRFRRMEDAQVWWNAAVQVYSAAALTFTRDKLPAISGVARRIHARTGNKYIAGLWYDATLEIQLCWTVCSYVSESSHVRRAPSWSWTSVNHQVSFHDYEAPYIPFAHVIDAKTFPLDWNDPFGEVSGGCITLACPGILPGRIGDDWDWELPVTPWVLVVHCEGSTLNVNIEPDSRGNTDIALRDQLYILPLVSQGQSWEGTAPSVLHGIIIRSTGANKGEFHRVAGFYMFYGTDHEDDDINPLLHALEKNGSQTARSVCSEEIDNTQHPSERFVITIV